MKKTPNLAVERYRVRSGRLASSRFDGNNGAFAIPSPSGEGRLAVIVSDGLGWEHASVSIPGEKRCPTWEEMDYVKRLFWGDTEAVMQLHPPRGAHISDHDFCLHLWKPDATEIPLPPSLMVGLGIGSAKLARMSRDEVAQQTTERAVAAGLL